MYTLHIGNKNYSSWSLRPWALMKALGIDFHEQLHRFTPESAGGAFRKFSPSGRVPLLVDGTTAIWDSLAITEYLAEKHDAAWPKDGAARAWARCASAEMHSGFSRLRADHSMNIGVRITVASRSPELLSDIARVQQLWSEGLSRFGGPFLAGAHFSAVDAFFAPVVFRFQTYDVAIQGAAAEYQARMLELPALKEWEAAALAEDFRDDTHDGEATRVGTLNRDLRARRNH